MKNFNLASSKFFRKAIGFLLIGLASYFSIGYVNTNFEVFIFLIALTFSMYLVLEYSTYGTDEYISVDFRNEEEKHLDEIQRQKDLVKGAVNHLLMEASMGNISKRSLEERLELIEVIKIKIDKGSLLPSGNYAELPSNNEYV